MAQAAGEIAVDISEVDLVADEMANSSSKINQSAQEFSKMTEQLK